MPCPSLGPKSFGHFKNVWTGPDQNSFELIEGQGISRSILVFSYILKFGGKLDLKAGNGHQKKAGGVGAGASATVEEPETELCGGKDMRLVKGKSMPSLR